MFFEVKQKRKKKKPKTGLTPTQPHGTHSPSIRGVSVCLHRGKLVNGLEQAQTYSARVLDLNLLKLTKWGEKKKRQIQTGI